MPFISHLNNSSYILIQVENIVIKLDNWFRRVDQCIVK